MRKPQIVSLRRALASFDKSSLWPYAALTLSMLCFSSNYVVGRLAPGEVPPIGLSFWRWVVAAIIILPFTWRGILEHALLIKNYLKLYFELTFFLVILGNTTIYLALNYTTAINASIVAMAEPVVTILLTWLFFRETITKSQALGVLIAAAGVLIVILRGNLLALSDIEFNSGDLWMLASVSGFASYAAFLRKSPKQIPPIILINIVAVLGVILLLPFYIWETTTVMPMNFNLATVISVLWVAIIVAAAGFGLWNVGIREVGANKASAFIYLRLLFATVLAIIILGETLKVYHFPAFILIIAGVYLVSRAKRQAN